MSEASVTDLTKKLDGAANESDAESKIQLIKSIISKLPLGGNNDAQMQQAEDIKSQAMHFNPDSIVSPEVQQQLRRVLTWHDDVIRSITEKLDMIPGLTDLIEEITNALTACKRYGLSSL